MQKRVCASCSAELPISQLRLIDEKPYCASCAGDVAASSMQGFGYAMIDPTICTRCCTDWGSTELPSVGGFPYCSNCRDHLYRYPFPQWLKTGLVVSLVLLFIALAHGAKYFRLGRQYYRGQQSLEAKKYSEAGENLGLVATAAPSCEKCVLLAAKAYLLGGFPDKAWDITQVHNNGNFQEELDEVEDVKRLFARVDKSAQLLEHAAKLLDQHHEREALKLAEEAADAYPEWEVPRNSVQMLRAGLAFDEKDYDGFLSIARDYYKTHPHTIPAVAQLASALACKYAVTGDDSFRKESEEMLANSLQLAQSKEAHEFVNEYADRIRHRLSSREIITKEEYDQRFRSGKEAKQ